MTRTNYFQKGKKKWKRSTKNEEKKITENLIKMYNSSEHCAEWKLSKDFFDFGAFIHGILVYPSARISVEWEPHHVQDSAQTQ